jgi:ABC-type branched-subunit amino acid transport system substrate-binding protein
MANKAKRTSAKIVIVATAAAMMLAACSSSSKGTSSNTTATSSAATSATTAAPSAAPIKVDVIMTLSGAQGAPFPGLQDGIAARIQRLNNTGGAGGRKVQIVNVLDDAGSPTTNADQIQKAVQQDKVDALFLTSNVTTKASTDYLLAHQVPFFGWAYLPWYCDNKLGFGWAGCSDGRPNTSAVGPATIAAVGKPASGLRVAVQAADDPASAGSLTGVVQQYKSEGAQVIYTDTSISGSTQTTDYSPYVQRVLAAKPDLVYTAMNFQNVVGFTAALIGAGFKGFVFNGVGYLPGVIQKSPDIAKGLNGGYIFNSVPAEEENTPAIQQIKADMTAINKPTDVTLGVAVGYWSADVFAQMAQKIGKDFSGATVDTLANTTGFTTTQVPGGACPVTFPAMHTSAPGGAGVEQLLNGSYKVIVKYQCWFKK